MNDDQVLKVTKGQGFIAALDQSGGSTPKALREYGVSDDAYSNDEEMFDLVHQMRSRIFTSPSFTGDKVLAAILFVQTMQRQVEGVSTSEYLWQTKNVVPFLKVDEGLAEEADGVQLMKPMTKLDDWLRQAVDNKVFGTKMRSVVKRADKQGISAILDQQFEVGRTISSYGLVPILEPEVDIHSPDKQEAEDLLLAGILERLTDVEADKPLMLKLSIPSVTDLYAPLIADPRVMRVVALSGGYDQAEACELLTRNAGLIASFSRALLEGLHADQSDEQFDAILAKSIDKIYAASTA